MQSNKALQRLLQQQPGNYLAVAQVLRMHTYTWQMVICCAIQEQYNDALQQLEQLLHQQPGNYTALAQLLTLLRRVGRMEEGQAYLHTAQEHVSRTGGTAGG